MAENTTTVSAQAPAKPAAAIDPKAVPAAKPVEEATETLKVNGKEIKLTKAQLIAAAQKGLFADQTLKSVDVLKKSTQGLIDSLKSPEQFIATLKANAKSLGIEPKAYLRELVSKGLIEADDLDFLAEQTASRWLPRQKMTPEQLEQAKKLEEYEILKKQEETRKQQQASAQQKQQIQQIYTAVRAEVTKQIKADNTFPQTEGSISAVINTLRAMNKKGASLTAENVTKALEKVKKDHLLHQQAILDADKESPDYGEKLIARIGEERAIAISRALVARLKAKTKAAEKDAKKENLKDTLGKKLNVLPSGHTIMETGW